MLLINEIQIPILMLINKVYKFIVLYVITENCTLYLNKKLVLLLRNLEYCNISVLNQKQKKIVITSSCIYYNISGILANIIQL